MEGGGGLQATDLQRRFTTALQQTKSSRRTIQSLDRHGYNTHVEKFPYIVDDKWSIVGTTTSTPGFTSGQPTCIGGIGIRDRRLQSLECDNIVGWSCLEDKLEGLGNRQKRHRRRRRLSSSSPSSSDNLKLTLSNLSNVSIVKNDKKQDYYTEDCAKCEDCDEKSKETFEEMEERRRRWVWRCRGIRQITEIAVRTLLLGVVLLVTPGLCHQDAVHITAILGESVVFNCHVEFPGEHPVPYVLQWEKKVGDKVRYRTNKLSALYP